MKNWTHIICLLLCMPLGAQTKVTKKIAAKSNDYGVTYSLPKTLLIVNVEVIKTTEKAAPYYRYAEKYLGVKNPLAEDKTTYQIGKLSLSSKGVPDADNTYIVEFKPGSTAPYVCLTEEGLICSINAACEPADEQPPVHEDASAADHSGETDTSIFFEELLMAGSTARQAEVAARQIYRIHESRLNILTGEADNLPPDGEAMKLVIRQLEQQEKALTTLFTGSSSRESAYYDITLTPYEDLEREVLFRFSDLLGIVDADDLAGTPVYIHLKASGRPAAPPPDPRETEKKDKTMKGIIYNVPGKAGVEIQINRKTLFKGEVPVAQFGYRENLAPVMFEDRKKPVKIYFYPQTGAIKEIIQ